MQIQIIPCACGGTEFAVQPHRLHLGAQGAEGVDTLRFCLPEAWEACAVTLHIKHSDGTLAVPIALDSSGIVSVGRSFTGWRSGEWMLAATDGNGYAAYTRPGRYDVHGVLSTDGTTEEPSPSLYEQFIAQVAANANAAAESAQNAAASESGAKTALTQTRTAARQAASNSSLASSYASRAEAAASRAESYAPTEGVVLSVNGKGGAVTLSAQEIGALPCPAAPVAGGLLRVLAIDPDTGALTVDTVAPSALSSLV